MTKAEGSNTTPPNTPSLVRDPLRWRDTGSGSYVSTMEYVSTAYNGIFVVDTTCAGDIFEVSNVSELNSTRKYIAVSNHLFSNVNRYKMNNVYDS